jgi:PAS domain S-box-containing protein
MTSLQQTDSFEPLNYSVMTRTAKGIITFWNRRAEVLYGWRKEEAVGRVSHDLLRTQFPQPIGRDRIRTGVQRAAGRQARAYHPRWRPRDRTKLVDFESRRTARRGG